VVRHPSQGCVCSRVSARVARARGCADALLRCSARFSRRLPGLYLADSSEA
jgi:hypothetical protein